MSLQRFIEAQQNSYESAVSEIRSGRKLTHWMWFIFPQIEGLGSSPKAVKYAIEDVEEAEAYLDHPILGDRLYECCDLLLHLQGKSAFDIFGFPDELKLRSSMTLFAEANNAEEVFKAVLQKYFHAQPDAKTLALLEK